MTTYSKCLTKTINIQLSQMSSLHVIFKVSKSHTLNSDNFRHLVLSRDEMQYGCKLGIDSWADTCCAGKHAHVLEFIEGKSVTASGFSSELGSLSNLAIANVAYSYDTPLGETLILVINNAIYLGEHMSDSLANPIQCMDNGVLIDIRPRFYYPGEPTAQTIQFSDDAITLPIEYDGPLPYITVRRPTPTELQHCRRITLTSPYNWDPYSSDRTIASTISSTTYIPSMDDPDDTSTLMSSFDADLIDDQRLLFSIDDDCDDYRTISAFQSSRTDRITPEELSRMWHVGLRTAARTLEATTHQCIRTTGTLTRRFRTDKAHLRYPRLSTHMGNFYVDTLKMHVKSIRGYSCGNVYTNKAGFKKFFPMHSETAADSAATLQNLIHLIGIPKSLHSDNHGNFYGGEFKKKARKFDIQQTFTEPNSPLQNRAEFAIGEIKSYARHIMQRTQTPVRLWCFAYEYAADLLSLCAPGRYELHGRTPYELVTHYTPDISEYVSY